jgi:hypothetical protein
MNRPLKKGPTINLILYQQQGSAQNQTPDLLESSSQALVSAPVPVISEQLKREYIETFFTKLAEDGLANSRRMNFWMRYVNCVLHIQFALGTAALTALTSSDPDMVALHGKLEGLISELDAPANNAFIMDMGKLTFVEFGNMDNALYGYKSENLPFDTKQLLRLGLDQPNSLKRGNTKRIFKKSHRDGARLWEDVFQDVLAKQFDLRPSGETPTNVSINISTARPLNRYIHPA